MSYTIFDTDTGNAVISFPSEAAALEGVRQAIATYGTHAVVSWMLVAYDSSGGEREIAEGEALIQRAVGVVA